MPSTPINFQPRLATFSSSIPQSSPHPSTSRPPALDFPMRPSKVPQPRPSPMNPSSQFQHVASTSNRSRVEQSPLPFPAA
ncbi:hypothetical protein O181_018964 [Austropuccinia psidii MF-1]|uniref:Uncharacterized protein n=1 Tax=Austropuccinia psidii MF-1 TaxID=1389203 RepID=A0A9Q3C664_9BASI|nr:hypothetical protein [Austropuccinia psidii MF-1]